VSQKRAGYDANKEKDVERLVVAPCGVLGAYERFKVTFSLHPQERSVKLASPWTLLACIFQQYVSCESATILVVVL
jgi:hypothetical protein